MQSKRGITEMVGKTRLQDRFLKVMWLKNKKLIFCIIIKLKIYCAYTWSGIKVKSGIRMGISNDINEEVFDRVA